MEILSVRPRLSLRYQSKSAPGPSSEGFLSQYVGQEGSSRMNEVKRALPLLSPAKGRQVGADIEIAPELKRRIILAMQIEVDCVLKGWVE